MSLRDAAFEFVCFALYQQQFLLSFYLNEKG